MAGLELLAEVLLQRLAGLKGVPSLLGRNLFGRPATPLQRNRHSATSYALFRGSHTYHQTMVAGTVKSDSAVDSVWGSM
jgi:hypothetical protein